LQKFIDLYKEENLIRIVSERLLRNPGQKLKLKGLCGSFDAIVLSVCHFLIQQNVLVIVHDKDEALYFINDLEFIFPGKDILLFPSSYKRPYEFNEVENANVLIRAEVLNRINRKNVRGEIIVTFPDALTEKVINKRSLQQNTLTVKVNDNLNSDEFIETLNKYDFEKTDFVFEAGQFSVRGGIIDVFSYANEYPYRIELSGDKVESIRTFIPDTQISDKSISDISLIPNIQTNLINESRESFLSFLPPNTSIWIKDFKLIIDVIDKFYNKALGEFENFNKKSGESQVFLGPNDLFEISESFKTLINDFSVIEFGNRFYFDNSEVINFSSGSQPSFNKNFGLLGEKLEEYDQKGYTCYISSESESQINRLRAIFSEIGPGIKFHAVFGVLRAGFIDHESKILLFTDHQIFERFHRFKSKSYFTKSKALTLRELKTLQPGDYVTHIDYGIGRFVGLNKIDVNGKLQEALRIIYKDDDLLYLSVQSLHKISRYSGKEGKPPSMSKLGSGDWDLKKRNVKKKVKDIAAQLIQLYAKRKAITGFTFSPDNYLQAELESSFIYEDTPDQAKSVLDVKRDMEKPFPMDRLVCGDVGFGKTEVAIRASFKAVYDSKQVAVLVPTTILAFQHYRTFTERLNQFPVKVEYISRFRSPSYVKQILKEIEAGKIDIIVGTHRLINKDVKFKDLGLLIIDEEQKFGVGMKEKLKEIKINVDTLTLTATPIPRTLQFSLMGARDLSIIATAPPNRQPVVTEIHTFNETLIRDAVSFEIRRGGQVFFVHNRISDIEEVANIILKLVPDAKISIAHGQMKGDRLEKIMLRFIEGECDVLVSTNIIESGLDIPNANTIIINRAHTFGLSDLHQMRGRVGRSNKKAYCYLLTPPISQMSSDSRKRLIALEEFSDLGDGFKVAMRDLDIRGAGNLLGAEQSGFINDLGFETYHQILDETINDLKENEFRDLFEVDLKKKADMLSMDCIIETDLEMLIPQDYINNISERLSLYERLDNIQNEDQLMLFASELRDRFGPVPIPVYTLMETVRLRWKAEKLGFEKLILKNNQLKAYFIDAGNKNYYNSEIFGSILQFVQQHPKNCSLKEIKNKPLFIIDDIRSIEKANKLFGEMIMNSEKPI
jgi:transcription-repair coupling factor (superfamily II helicase)